jgi:hypothetical protein
LPAVVPDQPLLIAPVEAVPPPPPFEPPPIAAIAPISGFDLATRAYARLAASDRRAADQLFAAALAAAPGAPQAAQWARERRRLNRHWSGDAYTLFRDAAAGGAAATPVLGGGQSGASLAYTPDPLARRPLAVIGRLYAAHDGNGRIDAATAQAAIGVRWQLAKGVSIAAERLIAIGNSTQGDWNLRIAAGGEQWAGPVAFDAYGEAGVRGNGDVYAGGEARAAVGVASLGPVRLAAGPGAWGSVQSGTATVSRADVGGGVAATGPKGLVVRADWRWRLAGNAAPGSGPAVTVAWSF